MCRYLELCAETVFLHVIMCHYVPLNFDYDYVRVFRLPLSLYTKHHYLYIKNRKTALEAASCFVRPTPKG